MSYSAQHLNSAFGALSPSQTLRLHLTWCWRGLYDASQWQAIYELCISDAEVRANLVKSLLLNTLSLVFIHFFDLFLHPLVRDQQGHSRNVSGTYQVLWIFPVVGASVYLNTAWSSIVARRTYTLLHGSRAGATLEFSGSSSANATGSARGALIHNVLASAYRGIMVTTSVLLDFTLKFIPWFGLPLSLIFLCWVNSYYFFESEWIGRGLSLPRRVQHLEERWAYYMGFGLPAACLCSFVSGLTSPALFALVYPPFIVLAMHSHPVPVDPYNPISSSDTQQFPSPTIPVRLPVFAGVLWLNDAAIVVVEALMRMGGVQFDASPFMAGAGPGASVRGGRGRPIFQKREAAEEGPVYTGAVDTGRGVVRGPGARFRVGEGGRRKFG